MSRPFSRFFTRTAASLALTSIASLNTPSALAAYSQPVTWSDMGTVDLKSVFRSQYASDGNLYDSSVSEATLAMVLKDSEARIHNDFHIPPSLKAEVGFWLRVYTEFTTQHVVIYDSKHPELVYDVLDFRPLAQTARNAVVYEIVSKKRLKKAMAAYRAAIARVARNPKLKNPSREEKNVLAALKKLPHKHPIASLAQNVRAQTGQRDNIIKGLVAAEAFFPKMEMLFTSMNVPLELTRLTLVESSFNLKAISKVGASGVWQFMPASGKEFMTINDDVDVDERLSPLKSTVAAAKLLKRNKFITGHWALAITSFNHGTRGMPHVKTGEDGSDISDFQHLFDGCTKRKGKHLGFASRSYYAEFLAVLHAEAYRNHFYGKAPSAFSQPVAFHRVAGGKTAVQLAMDHGVSMQSFQQYNPDVLNIRKKLPRGFTIAVPGEEDDFSQLLPRLGGKRRLVSRL